MRRGLRYRFIALTVVVAAGAALAACGPTKKAPPRSPVVFDTVGVHTFTVPAGVTQLTIDAYGAEGGDGQPAGM